MSRISRKENRKLPAYDKEEVFDNQILPLTKQIQEICYEHKIPFMTYFQVAMDPSANGSGLGVTTGASFALDRPIGDIMGWFGELGQIAASDDEDNQDDEE